MFFDTHAHYDDERFDNDRDAVLKSLPEAGIGAVVNPGCTADSSRAAIALAERYDIVYAAVGLHPENCAGADEADFAALEALAAHPKAVAIGEIGLEIGRAGVPKGSNGPADGSGGAIGSARGDP